MELDPATLQQLERLAQAGIRIVPTPALDRHFILEKDGFIALVENRAGRFGGIGSPGLMTDHGFAPLISGSFVCRGYTQPATPEQIGTAQAFFTQLKAALR